MKQYTVLVTSIGGDLGKAVCKALRFTRYNIRILGADCRNYVPHPLFCDEFQVIPKAGSSDYIDFFNKFINTNSIDIIYICSEQELLYICDNFHDIPREIFSRIAMPPLKLINICRDKYKTMQFLKENGFPYPNSVVYDNSKAADIILKDFRFPFIMKKTSDCGSKHFHIINSHQDFTDVKDLDETYMIQEYIGGTEYTNGVYRDALSGETYVITFERTLKDGMSDEVKVIYDEKIKNLCIDVAKKMKLSGSMNIQLRKPENDEPVIFEINPRYSSTAFMRAKFGFNDVIFAFENIVLKKSCNPPQIIAGEAYRYITEYYKYY